MTVDPHMAWSGVRQIKVAEMPRAGPGPGLEYLSIIDERPLPVAFDLCKASKRQVSVTRPYRYLSSLLRTFMARANKFPCEQRYYYDMERCRYILRVVDGVDDCEIERPVMGKDDWTTRFDWALAVRHRDPAGDWVAEGRFFFHLLPHRLQFSVPWKDEARTQRHLRTAAPTPARSKKADGERKWECSFSYSDASDRPDWCAEIRLQHKSLEGLLAADDTDPWGYLSLKRV